MNTSNAFYRLQTHGVKPSVQRLAVMAYLLEHRTHPTVEEIYEALAPEMPTLSRTTVYNTLRLLVEKQAVTMLTIDERRLCFDGDTSRHSHLLCKLCGRVVDITEEPVNLLKQPETLEGHRITEMQTYYKGICRKCLENERMTQNIQDSFIKQPFKNERL